MPPETETQLNESLTPSSESPITSDILQGQTDFQFEPVATPTDAKAEQARFESMTEQQDVFREEQEQKVESAQKQEAASFEDQINVLLDSPTKEELEASAFAVEGGVDDIKVELDAINSDIRAEQHALRREIEALEDNKEGLFGTAVQDKIDEATRKSLRKQADLAVIQMSVQGRFDSAKEIADRAVNIAYAREERRLEASSLLYERNKDIFDREEQRDFEVRLADRERKLTAEKEAAQLLSDTKLEALKMAQLNNAPMDIIRAIQSAETPEEVTEVGGKWGAVDLLDRRHKEMQIANIQSQISERAKDVSGEPELSSAEKTALGFAERTLDASIVLDEIGEQFASDVAFGGILPSAMQSADRQRYEQAKRNFVNAVLRRESGAAIGADEFDNAEVQYFPQRGDSVSVVLQKKQNRNRVIANLLREGGQDATAYVNAYNDPMGLGISENTTDPLGLNETSTIQF